MLSQKLLWCVWMCESICISTDISWYSVFCKICSLFSWKLLFTGVFVQSPLCSFFFPYMEISNTVYIIASIHQEMQFAHLPGSVMWRTACNCLSHHLWKKKNLKSNCISDILDAHEKEEGVGGWERSFSIYAAIYIVPSWCQWNSNF